MLGWLVEMDTEQLSEQAARYAALAAGAVMSCTKSCYIQVVQICMFMSECDTSAFGFTDSQPGENLPAALAPRHVLGVRPRSGSGGW
jgi:hypothetical protein